MDCRGDPWIMVIFGWLSQNPPFYYYSHETIKVTINIDELMRSLMRYRKTLSDRSIAVQHHAIHTTHHHANTLSD